MHVIVNSEYLKRCLLATEGGKSRGGDDGGGSGISNNRSFSKRAFVFLRVHAGPLKYFQVPRALTWTPL